MLKENNKKRKFSLEEDFMNLTVDDLILGYIHHLATYIPEKKILYVTEKQMSSERKAMAAIIDRTPQTVRTKIKKLVEMGLITQEQLELNGQKELVYIIPQNTIGKYEIIYEDIMWYIICTRKRFILKIYLYLLNKYDWKKELGADMYSFTLGELAEVIGYSKNCAATGTVLQIISMALTSLRNEGIIDFVDYSDGKATRKRLTYVAHTMKELEENNKVN